jgi:hypothetical protein
MSAPLQSSLSGGVRILRERIWVIHDSEKDPRRRQIIKEYTLFNESDDNITDIIIDINEFLLGLRIFDQDGSELSFYPKNFIHDLLKPYFDEKELEDLLAPGRYFLWIPLGSNRQIKPGEARLLKLVYFDPKEVKSVSRLVSPFSIPRFELGLEKERRDYDTFFIIQAPMGYTVKYSREKAEMNNTVLTEKHGFYEDVYDYVINVRIPVIHDKSIYFSAKYDIFPPKVERTLFYVSIIPLYFMAVLMLASSVGFNFLPPPLIQILLRGYKEIIAGIATAALAIAGLIRDPLLDRSRFYYLVAGAIAIISYFIFLLRMA